MSEVLGSMKSIFSSVHNYHLPVLVALLYLLAFPAHAQTGASVAQENLGYLVQHAERIVHGSVVSAILEPDPQFSNLKTVLVTIEVVKTFKGSAEHVLRFRQYVWNSKDSTGVGGYHKSEEILLFLNPVSEYGLTSPVGMEQGQFRVMHDNKCNSFAVNGRGNVGLFSGVLADSESRGISFSTQARTMLSRSSGKVSLPTLEETIQALVTGHDAALDLPSR